MRKHIIRVYSRTFLIIFCLICCNGCWDRKELKTQGLVAAMGIDRTMGGKGIYLFTFQVIKPNEVSQPKGKSGGGSGSEPPVWVRASTGRTPFEAGRNIALQSSRRMFFSHNQAFIISKETAKQGIRQIIDLVLRFNQMRLLQNLLIAKNTAKEVLEVSDGLEKIPAFEISGMLVGSQYTSEAIPITMQDFFGFLISKTRAPIAPQIEVFSTGRDKSLKLSGMAVFNKDRWVGELNNRETRGLLWVLGQVNRGIINIPSQRGTEAAVSEIYSANSKIEPELSHHRFLIRIQINTEGNLENILVPENLTAPAQLHRLEKLESGVIRREILAAWQKARQLDADIFGFGEAFHRKYPREWKSLESKWDQIFLKINLDIKINNILKHNGEILQPPMPK